MTNFDHPAPPLTAEQLLQDELGAWIHATRQALYFRLQEAANAVASSFLSEEEGQKWYEEELAEIGRFLEELPSADLLRIMQQGRVERIIAYVIYMAQGGWQTPCGSTELMGSVWQELQEG